MRSHCPVHGTPLQTGPGFRWPYDVLPSAEFAAAAADNPCALEVDEALTARPGVRMIPCTLTWCARCQAEVERRLRG